MLMMREIHQAFRKKQQQTNRMTLITTITIYLFLERKFCREME